MKHNSQQPEVKACQGEGKTNSSSDDSEVVSSETTDDEVGISSRNLSADTKIKKNKEVNKNGKNIS